MNATMILLEADRPKGEGVLDTVIAALIILFVLSLINEKVVDLIRKYSKVSTRINRFKWLRNVNKSYSDSPEINEKKKKEINLLAVLIGIGVAALSKASLFDLFSPGKSQENLFWSSGDTINGHVIWFIIGIILTGFFLSFGSKFFHDLLDVLYQTKEYKRKLQNAQINGFTNANDINAYMNTNAHQLAKKALAIHGKEIKEKYQNLIVSMEVGTTVHNEIGIIINVTAEPPSDFPRKVTVALPNGAITKIEIETHILEIAEAHFGLDFRLQNPDKFGKAGALGGILVADKTSEIRFLLTCSHVVLGGSSKNLGGFPENGAFNITTEILEDELPKTIGKVVYAKLDATSDSALVAMDDQVIETWKNEFLGDNFFKEAISTSMLNLTEEIGFYSSLNRKEVKGVIHKIETQEKVGIRYDDGKVKLFDGLIVVGNNRGGFWSSISQKGDSGAILYDENKAPFGLIIGGSRKYTYAVPLTKILNATHTQIFTN